PVHQGGGFSPPRLARDEKARIGGVAGKPCVELCEPVTAAAERYRRADAAEVFAEKVLDARGIVGRKLVDAIEKLASTGRKEDQKAVEQIVSDGNPRLDEHRSQLVAVAHAPQERA